MAQQLELLVIGGALAGKRYKVSPGGLRLGRSSSNDLPIPDEALSRNHCLIELAGDEALRVTDLASANGTFVNGVQLGVNPVEIRPNDCIEVGETTLKVVHVGENPPATSVATSVDLGFAPKNEPPAQSNGRRRASRANVLWAVAVVAVLAAAATFFCVDDTKAPPPAPIADAAMAPTLREVFYEKVEADAAGIFRYELTLSDAGELRVALDDVPGENRHAVKSRALSADSLKSLSEILAHKRVKALGDGETGPEPDVPKLKSRALRVVYSDCARAVRFVNAPESDAFREICERLETFSKNELGVWAIQYSRDKLVKLAEDSCAAARAKFDDRDVNYGNLAAAVAAYREAMFYLETVNPKPPSYAAAAAGLDAARKELDRRVADQRFQANRACNLGQWAQARRELSVLVEMVPDRADPRNREAMAKLLDVEKRLQKGAK